jgi:hypothetical protein
MPNCENYVRGKELFKVQNGAISTLSNGPDNHRLLFVWYLKAKPQGIDVCDDEELKSEIMTIFQRIPSDQLTSHSITGSKDTSGLPQMQEILSIIARKCNLSFIHAFLIGAHVRNLLDTLCYQQTTRDIQLFHRSITEPMLTIAAR